NPMYPPPITSSVFGTSGRSSALVESMRRGLSSLRLGTTLGREPVAMMMRSKVRFSSPPAVFITFNVVEFTNAALPWTNWTERCLDNCPSPPVSFLTTLSFHPRSLFRSTLGSPNSMPQFFACSVSSSSLAACSRALDGMQPRYRQTPPGFTSGSIIVTFMPKSAARNAAAYPPGPPPITATRRFEVLAMSSLYPLPGQLSDVWLSKQIDFHWYACFSDRKRAITQLSQNNVRAEMPARPSEG